MAKRVVLKSKRVINSNSRKTRDESPVSILAGKAKEMVLSLNKPTSAKTDKKVELQNSTAPAPVQPTPVAPQDSTTPVPGETAGVPRPIITNATDNSKRAVRFIDKLEADDGFMNDVNVTIEANDISRAGGFIIMLDMKRALPAELITELPAPDSEGGNNPDIYQIEDSKRKGRFYNDLFDLTAKGKKIVFQLDQIDLAKDTKTFKSAEELYQNMDIDVRDKLEARLKEQRSYGRRVLKQAASLILKLKEIEDGLPKLGVKYPEDVTETTPRPFVMFEKDNPMQFKALTAAELLSINVEKANAKVPGGSKAAVLATLGKEKRETGGEASEDTEQGVQVKGDTFEDTCIALSNFVRDIWDDKKLLGRFYAKLNGREGDGLLLALFDLNDLLDRMIDKPELRDKYLKLQSEYSADKAAEERKAS